MATRSPRQRLQDIVDAIADIEKFTAGKSFEAYAADALLRRAYDHVNDRRVWAVVTDDLLPLKEAVRAMIGRIGPP